MTPKRIGKDGPYISRSRRPILPPFLDKAHARFVAIVDLPTPPLPLAIARTCLTLSRIDFGEGDC